MCNNVIIQGYSSWPWHRASKRSALQVVAVDTDATRLELVAHNARIYGVQHRIELLCADFFQVAPRLKVCLTDGASLINPSQCLRV